MPFTADAKEGMLGQVRGRISHLSLHDGAPGGTGANEIAGGGYARAAVEASDFTAPSGNSFALAADQEFDGTPSQGVTHLGAWDDDDFLGEGELSGDSAFNAEGVYVVTEATTFSITDPS